ncbi:MAG: hypothetical protein IJ193_01355, partial [Bacilli bacterium]|nr:hypothetical protein [Bacilli bacterium]
MKIKWKKQWIITIMEYVLALLVAALMTLKLIDGAYIQNDIFFDLKTGESILKYGVDFKDHFSFIPNLIYTYHHWLYDVIFYLLYKKFGFVMIKYLFTGIFFFFGSVVFYVNKRLTNSNLLGTIVMYLTFFLATHFLQTRVQSITYGLLLLEYLCIDQLYQKGKKRYFIPLFLIGIIIANLHMPVWILSLVFFLPFLAEMILYYIAKLWKKKNNYEIDNTANWLYLLIAFAIVAVTGLCTPLKLYPYTFFLKCMNNDTYTFINEMQKTALITYKNQLIMMVIGVIGVYLKIFKLKIRDFCYLIGLFLMSLMA